jgi:hypothetical protein
MAQRAVDTPVLLGAAAFRRRGRAGGRRVAR